MGKYEPPYTISNKMLELVSSISEKVGKISSHGELEARPHLRKNNRIRSIHSSLKIEANSLSLAEVRDVINGHLVLGEFLNKRDAFLFKMYQAFGHHFDFIAIPIIKKGACHHGKADDIGHEQHADRSQVKLQIAFRQDARYHQQCIRHRQ